MTAQMQSELLEGLTPPQVEAATHVDGPILVLAGPGSGKTRVITRRVAFLVREVGLPPWNILAITFTNKAAGEMRDRVAGLLTERQSRAVTLSTFHALCARILRMHGDRLDLPPGYSIYDTSDQKNAIKQALNDLEINTKNFPPPAMLSSISDAKQKLLSPEGFAVEASDFYSRTVAKVYAKYAQILKKNNAVDFDDLLLKTVELFREHRDVLDGLRERYQYVMIDEYQDTNHAQFVIANALAAEHTNLMATGDPDQSIYGWRGANIQNILDFETRYPGAKTVRLEQNYRSTKTILKAADALIANNSARKHKTLWTDNPEGERVRVIGCVDERAEARTVVEKLRELQGNDEDGGVQWGDMAVFYRINSLSRVMEDALRDAAIPYQIARGTAFYDRKEIKDAVAYLRVIANPADEVNLLRVVNTPARGISKNTIEALQAASLADDISIDRLMADPTGLSSINTRAQSSVAKFAQMVAKWRQAAGLDADDAAAAAGGTNMTLADEALSTSGSLAHLVERVLRESDLETYYRNDKSDPDGERVANLGELVSSARQFEDDLDFERSDEGIDEPATLREKLLGFLERISLVADVDAVDNETGAVTLMTLHAAKGLEFPVVAMIGFEDGLLPHDRAIGSSGSASELEEERRLAFVGITRAERHLLLTHAAYRTIFGQTTPTIRSRFLNEIPEDVLNIESGAGDEEDVFDMEGRRQRHAAGGEAGRYPRGTLVRHPQFGLGRVVQVSAMGAHTRARIEFNTVGAKTLVLQYARLERVEM